MDGWINKNKRMSKQCKKYNKSKNTNPPDQMYVSLLLISPLLFKYIKLSVTHRLMLHATDQRAVSLNLSSDADVEFLTKLSKIVLDIFPFLNIVSLNLKHCYSAKVQKKHV